MNKRSRRSAVFFARRINILNLSKIGDHPKNDISRKTRTLYNDNREIAI
jgi:hypothetical protein